MQKKINFSQSSWQQHLRNAIIVLLFVIFLTQVISPSIAQEEDGDDGDDGGIASSFGWAAVGLFGASILYVIFYHGFKISRKILPDNDRFKRLRDFIRDVFIKVRKPLLFLHYFAGITALIILFTHGIALMGFEAGTTIIGWIIAYIYLFYVISGILIKTLFKKVKKAIKLKLFLIKVHNNLIILVIIGLIHIAHLAIAD